MSKLIDAAIVCGHDDFEMSTCLIGNFLVQMPCQARTMGRK